MLAIGLVSSQLTKLTNLIRKLILASHKKATYFQHKSLKVLLKLQLSYEISDSHLNLWNTTYL